MSNTLQDFEIEKIGRHPTFLGIRLIALVEIIVFFLIMFLLSWLLKTDFNFYSVCPHPFWIIVILISAQYGTIEGLIAAIVASCIFLLGPLPQRNILQDRLEYTFFLLLTPILWIVAAVVIGEIRRRHMRERDKLKEAALNAEARERTIAIAYESLKKTKEHIEVRFASGMQTALMAFEAFKEIELLGKDEIIKGALDLTRILIAPDKFSIYLLEGNLLKRIAFEGWKENDSYATNVDSTSPLFQEIVGKHRVLTIINAADREILQNQGVLAVPIIVPKENKVLGMIKIEEISFLRLRITTIESLRTIGEWVGTAYASFLEKQFAEEERLVSGNTRLLSKNFFLYEKEFLIQLGKRLKISIVLLTVSLVDPKSFSEESRLEIAKAFRQVVKDHLRTVDQAFEYESKEGEFAIMLINTTVEQSEIVRQKIGAGLEHELGKNIQFTYRVIPLYEKD